MTYIILFFSALIICASLVPIARRLAFKIGAVDVPKDQRRIHTKPIARLGGSAIFLAFFSVLLFYLHFGNPNYAVVPIKFFLAIFLGALILMFGGILDDKYNLAPRYTFIFPALASLIVVLFGIGVGITQLTNPFGQPISLAIKILGIPLSGIFVWFFIMGMTYTTKFLDGMDGLAGGIAAIASLTLFFLSLTARINQPITAALAIILCGSLIGFLIYNFNPASIFLGEGGSVFLGFMLGTLSVLLGGKIATAILVMGIPIMDVAWVIVRRLCYGVSPFKGDRKHLHYRLLDIGFSQKQTVLILYGIAAIFGFVAIFLQAMGKLISLLILIGVMLVLAFYTVIRYKEKENKDGVID